MRRALVIAALILAGCSGSSGSSSSSASSGSTTGSGGGSSGSTGSGSVSLTGALAFSPTRAYETITQENDGGRAHRPNGAPNLALPGFTAVADDASSQCAPWAAGAAWMAAGYVFEGNESVDDLPDLAPGTYPIFVGPADGSGSYVRLSKPDPAGGADVFDAKVGSVTFTAITAQRIAGSFDVMVVDQYGTDGGELSGTFDALACP